MDSLYTILVMETVSCKVRGCCILNTFRQLMKKLRHLGNRQFRQQLTVGVQVPEKQMTMLIHLTQPIGEVSDILFYKE
jgi:hypothetical protein